MKALLRCKPSKRVLLSTSSTADFMSSSSLALAACALGMGHRPPQSTLASRQISSLATKREGCQQLDAPHDASPVADANWRINLRYQSTHVPDAAPEAADNKPAEKAAKAKDSIPDYNMSIKQPVEVVRKLHQDVIHDPQYNKGTAFPPSERDRLGLRGLLPPMAVDMSVQLQRFMSEFKHGTKTLDADQIKSGGITNEMVRQWKLLHALKNRNETLYYKVLLSNIAQMAPIVYTPTVGWACVNFHKLYTRPGGMYFSAKDRGEMAAMVWNWQANEVDAIVLTDGGRILGLGDWGANGLVIPRGKLDLYVAAAGFHPSRVLPIVLDVGTDNETLRDDPLYIGLRRQRMQGGPYYQVVDELVQALVARWPNAILQFEDFSTRYAHDLLERYRHTHLMFNDDIQGTAATALAGIYGALRVQGMGVEAVKQLKVVMVGAGSAARGVMTMIKHAMVSHGMSEGEASRRFWVVDDRGLLTQAREGVHPSLQGYAREADGQLAEGASIEEVVRQVQPSALVGLSGAGRLFTPAILQEMGRACPRPIIFPMSNPTSQMECTSHDAQVHTDGRAIFASGSPQPDVVLDGKRVASSQANNVYVFPGLALGAFLGNTRIITDGMILAAALALPDFLTDNDIQAGRVYPNINQIRDISSSVALQVALQAGREGILRGTAAQKLAKGEAHLLQWIKQCMYDPVYRALIHLPPGVNE